MDLNAMPEFAQVNEQRPRRKWHQFSIRALLLATLVCGVLLYLSIQLWAWLHQANVDGWVHVDGSPLQTGEITFNGPLGPAARKTIAAISKGEFKLRLAEGTYRVEFRSPRTVGGVVTETLPAMYNSNTVLAIEVKGGANTIDFELTSVQPSASVNRSSVVGSQGNVR
jgi:hypothetical protein